MKIRLPLVAALVCISAPALAQLELPRPSPNAKVSQVVGLTEISVEYSSPSVRGRKIWGGLLPYDQLWRTGANAATKITFSKDVQVAGHAVPAGSYSIFTIPSKGEWTVILNKNPTASTGEYKQELDQLRFKARPKAIPHREHLAFLFSDFNDAGASLDLEWEKVRITFPIQVDTAKQTAKAIDNIDETASRMYTQAARYEMDKKNYDAALKLCDKALQLKEDWLAVWTKASILAAKGKYKDAYPLAQKADELGAKSAAFFFKADVEKALNDWKKKI